MKTRNKRIGLVLLVLAIFSIAIVLSLNLGKFKKHLEVTSLYGIFESYDKIAIENLLNVFLYVEDMKKEKCRYPVNTEELEKYDICVSYFLYSPFDIDDDMHETFTLYRYKGEDHMPIIYYSKAYEYELNGNLAVLPNGAIVLVPTLNNDNMDKFLDFCNDKKKGK